LTAPIPLAERSARRLSEHLRAFERDESGAIGVVFALVFMVPLLMVALAIDFGRADLEMQRIQRATDAAALAASHRLGLDDQETSGPDMARRFFDANVSKQAAERVESVTLDAVKGQVVVSSGGTIFTSLLNAVGLRNIGLQARSRVVKGDGTIEIALVVDNSGSMAGQPIADLQAAAQSLTQVVFTGAEDSDRVQMAIVPFSGAVNVGSDNRVSPWMDEAGLSSLNGANFSANVARFTVFDRMGVSWRGCVEARPAPYDVTDAPAAGATPDTLFVPMLAPDEPDSVNSGGQSYNNSYLVDDGGTCTPQPTVCTSYNRRGACTNWQKTPIPAAEAQARLCKYETMTAPSPDGPNYMCDSEPLLPLTGIMSLVESKISSLIAKGNTNIGEGLAWGWRVLSPVEPFTEGRAYDAPNNDKIIILMTDGANTYTSASNHNKSRYGAFGYGAAGRLGTTYTNSGYVSRMNQKTLAVCANAKAAGIRIYTVAFRLESDPATLSLLQTCASEASKAFRASDGAALVSAFQRIGTEISKLRVAE
jgi:Flp pilus assembly protein TadG